MKNAKNIAIALLAIGTLAIVGQMCGAIGSVSETVQTMPDELAGAAATRTAIAPAIVPTVRYNEVVLPTQQAEEANQITATVKRRYENARQWDDFKATCKKIAVGTLTISTAIAVASGAGALVGAILCYIIERVKRAKDYEPVQKLPMGAILYPRKQIAANTLTGASWKITTEYPASIDHGTLLIEARTGPRFRVAGRNGERHPIVLEALRNG